MSAGRASNASFKSSRSASACASAPPSFNCSGREQLACQRKLIPARNWFSGRCLDRRRPCRFAGPPGARTQCGAAKRMGSPVTLRFASLKFRELRRVFLEINTKNHGGGC